MAFGNVIAGARKRSGLTQKELASRVRKEDGTSISPQYLNDIERNRRNPPSGHLLMQFARALALEPDYLHFVAGQIPPTLAKRGYDEERVLHAFKAFRRELDKKPG